jgi:phage N-6-adenine-methyltransferase
VNHLANDEWITQQYIFDWIQEQLSFWMILDLAADPNNTKCPYHIGQIRDALSQDWYATLTDTRVYQNIINRGQRCGTWCNPPYSKPNLPRFTEKACLEAEKGLNQCFLVPLDITPWSRNYVWGQAEVWIPDERIVYINPVTGEPQKNPPKGSMIAIYGPLANKGLIKPVHIPGPGEAA